MKKISKLARRVIGMTLACSIALVSGGLPSVSAADKTNVYVLGDSTGCDYSADMDTTYYYKRVGFGTRLGDYLTDDATVVNLAMSGRSSKSFTSESYYTTYKNSVSKGDYVIIAFGHNDEKAEDPTRYTEPVGDKDTAGSFKNSLYVNYIQPALAAGATPILATPVVRRTTSGTWSDSQLHKANGGDYAQAVRDLGKELGLTVIDNTQMTKDLYDSIGASESVYLHAWLSSKATSVDNTHLNNYGASYVAYMMANAVTSSDSGLKNYVKSGISAPSKDTALIVNPSYVEPDPDAADLDESELAKSVFKTTSPWYGTAFGDIGGVSKLMKNGELVVNTTSNRTNFDITEIDSKTVQIRTGDVATTQSFGKIADTSDAFTFYYMPVDAASNFEISADAKVNDVLINNQVSFGAVCLDRVSIDESNKNLYRYVAAGAVKFGDNAYVTFERNDDVLSTKGQGAYTPAKGDTVKVKLVKSGDNITATFGNVTQKYTNKMSGTVYFGFYTTRNCDVTFSNIYYSNEIVEGGDDVTEATTEAATEATTAEATTEAATTEVTTEAATAEATTEAAAEPEPADDFAQQVGMSYGDHKITYSSAVDSLNYKEVGFIFEYDGKSVMKSTNTVYNTIDESGFTAEELGGKYIYSFTIDDIKDGTQGEINVTAYHIDLDGSIHESIFNPVSEISKAIGAVPEDEVKSAEAPADIKEIPVIEDETLSGAAIEIPEVA
ncbi:MAG: hypothetical protein IJ062_02360 [Firmicutes bacterium]|nr:hypothetical protein [Bacillota bacterium]